jgi:type IV secretion system protein VirB6
MLYQYEKLLVLIYFCFSKPLSLLIESINTTKTCFVFFIDKILKKLPKKLPNYTGMLVKNIKGFVKILVLFATLNLTITQHVYAKDTLDTIIDTLTGLTCETQGVGDLLRTEFSHTCIPSSFFTFAIANLISPGIYANTMLRLKINDHELFDEDYPGGQCARNNKIDPNDPKLTFALCNNIKLAVVRLKAIAIAAVAIAKAVLTGTDPWDDIMQAWTGHKKDYHIIYKDKKEGFKEIMFDIGIIPVFPIKVVKIKDTMCVASPTILADWVPIGCKYIREPYPESIYSSFMDLSGGAKKGPDAAVDPMAIVSCGTSSSSCYQRAYNNSKTAVVISSPLIECIKEMTARLLISKDVCSFDDVNQVINSSKRETSIFFQFQRNMHRTVTALLTIYVIFFGFKMILSQEIPPRNEIINFILKMIFVTYFSVGINITPGSNSAYDRMDGMIQWAFPFLLGGIDTLAGWIMNASPSELCKFNGPGIVYNKTLSYMSLWDALDCRVSHYLGLDMLSTLLVENQHRKHDFANFDFFSFSAPPYVYLLIPAIISGNMTLINLAVAYPLLVISVGAFMVNATVMCMISIVILGVLAPLFVPMLLFEYTRGYFESWVKLLISFLLQPMIVVAFMIMMFSVYDFGFYGHCKYTSKTIKNDITSSLQSSLIGNSEADAGREVMIFYVDNDWTGGKYKDDDEVKSCKNSLGYMLNNPMATAFDFAKDNLNEIVKEKPGTGSTDDHLKKFSFLAGIVMGPGMFFVSPKLLFEKIKNIILALITACFTLYLMYHFSAQLANFAADMSEGVPLTGVAINPQAIYKAGSAAIGAAGGKAGGKGMDKGAGGGRGVGDKGGGGLPSADKGGGGLPAAGGGGGGLAGDKVGSGLSRTSAPVSSVSQSAPAVISPQSVLSQLPISRPEVPEMSLQPAFASKPSDDLTTKMMTDKIPNDLIDQQMPESSKDSIPSKNSGTKRADLENVDKDKVASKEEKKLTALNQEKLVGDIDKTVQSEVVKDQITKNHPTNKTREGITEKSKVSDNKIPGNKGGSNEN